MSMRKVGLTSFEWMGRLQHDLERDEVEEYLICHGVVIMPVVMLSSPKMHHFHMTRHPLHFPLFIGHRVSDIHFVARDSQHVTDSTIHILDHLRLVHADPRIRARSRWILSFISSISDRAPMHKGHGLLDDVLCLDLIDEV